MSQAKQSLFAMVVLLALFLRIIAPSGFMPVAGSHGLVLELCSGAAGKSVVIDVGKKSPGEKPQSADAPCAFAAGLGHDLAATPAAATIQPLAYAIVVPHGMALADGVVDGLAAPPPPSQGPPSLS